MAINQLSTSNTFSQWLTATQALITNYNAVEDTANLVFSTGNNVSNVYSNTVSVYGNTVNVYSNTLNTYNSIQTYVSVAFNAANAAFNTANIANSTATTALNNANNANTTANAAYFYAVSATGQVIPSQTANTGKYLSTNGTSLIWNTIDAGSLPSQTGNGGKYLTTDGSNASWANVDATGNTSAVANTIAQRDSNADLYANNFISTSDARLKENVRPIENALDIVRQLQGVKFNWKATNAEQIGLIAQEVEKVLPYVVFGNDVKAVNYGVIVSVLIEAVKELAERLDRLEK